MKKLKLKEFQSFSPVPFDSSLLLQLQRFVLYPGVYYCCSVTKLYPTLWPHGLQHARLPCPSLSPGVHSDSCPVSQWCHSTMSSSSVFSLYQLQGLFQWVGSLGQVAKVLELSASTSVLPMNTQDWSPLGLTCWISLQSMGLSRVFSSSSKASILRYSAFFMVQVSHSYMTTGKTIALTRWTFAGKVSLCFLICCLGLLCLFFQGASVLISWLHCLQWFWGPRI